MKTFFSQNNQLHNWISDNWLRKLLRSILFWETTNSMVASAQISMQAWSHPFLFLNFLFCIGVYGRLHVVIVFSWTAKGLSHTCTYIHVVSVALKCRTEPLTTGDCFLWIMLRLYKGAQAGIKNNGREVHTWTHKHGQMQTKHALGSRIGLLCSQSRRNKYV